MIFLTHLRPEKFTVFMALTVPEKQCYSVSYPVCFPNFRLNHKLMGKTLHKEISFPDHMGLIIENMELQPQLTAFENLEELNKINHYATTSDIQDALRKINLQSNEKVKKFSLGMKQKLNIAQAIFENPRLLLLDQPTNALDSDAIEHLKAILEDLKKKNCCIIIATHDHQNITSLCDQILEMKEGNLYDKN